MADSARTKIRFRTDNADIETMWAQDVGAGRYRIDNVPWFTYGISLDDVVATDVDADGGIRFRTMAEKSGNRTLRIILADSNASATLTFESQQVVPMLEALGCRWEGADRHLIAVNVPPSVNLHAVTDALDATDARWEYADPTPEEMGIVGDESGNWPDAAV